MSFLDTLGNLASDIGDGTGLTDAWHDLSNVFTGGGSPLDRGSSLIKAAFDVPLHFPGVQQALSADATAVHYATGTLAFAGALGHSSALHGFGDDWQRPNESFGDYASRAWDSTVGGDQQGGLSLGQVSTAGMYGPNSLQVIQQNAGTNFAGTPLDWTTEQRQKVFGSGGVNEATSGFADLVSGTLVDPINLLPVVGKLGRAATLGNKFITVENPGRLAGAWQISHEQIKGILSDAKDGVGTFADHTQWLADNDAAAILKSREAKQSGDPATFAYLMGQAQTPKEVADTYTLLGRVGTDADILAARDRLVATMGERGTPQETQWLADRILGGQVPESSFDDALLLTDTEHLDQAQAIFARRLTDTEGELARAYQQTVDQVAANRAPVVDRFVTNQAYLGLSERAAVRRATKAGSPFDASRLIAAPEVTIDQPTRFHPIMAVANFFTKDRSSGYINFHASDSVNEVAALIDDIDAVTGGAMRDSGEGRAWLNQYASVSHTGLDEQGQSILAASRMRTTMALEQRGFQLIAEQRGISAEAAQKMWASTFDRRAKAIAQHRDRGFASFLTDNGDTAVVKIPLLERQAANTLPLVDFRQVTKAIDEHDAGTLESVFRSGANVTIGAADVVNSIFKMSVLLRLGYTIRNITEAYASLFVNGYLGKALMAAGEGVGNPMEWMNRANLGGRRLIDRTLVARGYRPDVEVVQSDLHQAESIVNYHQRILDALRDGTINRANLNMTQDEINLVRNNPESAEAKAILDNLRQVAQLRTETTRRVTYHATDKPEFNTIDGDWIDTTPSHGVALGKADGVHTYVSWETANRVPFSFATKHVKNPEAFAKPAFAGGPGVQHGTTAEWSEHFDPEAARRGSNLVGGGLYTTDNRIVAHGYVSNQHFYTPRDDSKKAWDQYRADSANYDPYAWGDGPSGDGAVYGIEWTRREPPKVLNLEDVKADAVKRGPLSQAIVNAIHNDALPDYAATFEPLLRKHFGNSSHVQGMLADLKAAHNDMSKDLRTSLEENIHYSARNAWDGAAWHADFRHTVESLRNEFAQRWRNEANRLMRGVGTRDLPPGVLAWKHEMTAKGFDQVARAVALDDYDKAILDAVTKVDTDHWFFKDASGWGPGEQTFLNDEVFRDRLGYHALNHTGGTRYSPGRLDAKIQHQVYVWITDNPADLKITKLAEDKTHSVPDRDRVKAGYHKMLDQALSAVHAGKVVEIRRGSTWRPVSTDEIDRLRMRAFRSGDERALIRYRDPDKVANAVEVPSYGKELDLTDLANWPQDLKDELGVQTKNPKRAPAPRPHDITKFFDTATLSEDHQKALRALARRPAMEYDSTQGIISQDALRNLIYEQWSPEDVTSVERELAFKAGGLDLPQPREIHDANMEFAQKASARNTSLRAVRTRDGRYFLDGDNFLGPNWATQPHTLLSVTPTHSTSEELLRDGGHTYLPLTGDPTEHMVWKRGDMKPPKRRKDDGSISHREWVKGESWNDPEQAQALHQYAKDNGYGRIILPDSQWGQTVRVLKDTADAFGGQGAKPIVARNVDDIIREAEENGGVAQAMPISRTPAENRAARRSVRSQRRLSASSRQNLNGRPVRWDYNEQRLNMMLDGGAVPAIKQAVQNLADARARAEAARTTLTEVVNRRQRLNPTRDTYTLGHDIITPHGPVRVPGPFEGSQGEVMRRITSGDQTVENLVGDGSQILSQAIPSAVPTRIGPTEPRYFESWANVLNWHWRDPSTGKIDPMVARLLAGQHPSEVVSFLRDTPEGRAYADNMGWGDDQIAQAVDHLNQAIPAYLPTEEIRQLWASGKLDAAGLSARLGGRTDLPTLNGLLVPQSQEYADRNAAQMLSRKMTGRLFHLLGSMPETAWARHPLYVSMYNDQMESLVRRAVAQKGDVLTGDELNTIAATARERARVGLNKTLFTINRRTGAATNLRLVAPFYAAWENVLKRWGSFAIHNTEGVLRGARYLDRAASNAVLINDQTGQPATLHDTPFDQISMMLPFQVGGHDLRVPLASMDVVFQGQPLNPGLGPFVSLPLIKVMDAQPRAEQILGWAFPAGIPRDAGDVFMPAVVRRLKSYVTEDQSFVNDANHIMEMEIVRFQRGERNDLPKWSEIEDKTKKFYALKALTNLAAPFSVQYTDEVSYYTEQLRQYRALYGDQADQKFLTDHPEAFVVLEPLSDNKSGVRSTFQSVDNLKHYSDLAAEADASGDQKLLGWLANYGQGNYDPNSFSQAAYNWELANSAVPGGDTFRGKKNPEQIYTDAVVNQGWVQYRKYMDMAETQLGNMGVDLASTAGQSLVKKFRQAVAGWIGQSNQNWYGDYVSSDTSKYDKRAQFFEQVTSDKQFMADHKNDGTIQAIATFLQLRNEMAQNLLQSAQSPNGSKRIGAKVNVDLNTAYQGRINQMKQENLGFADFYDRYFANDPVVL